MFIVRIKPRHRTSAWEEWEVRIDGRKRAYKIYLSKPEAIQKGKQLARVRKKGVVKVYNTNTEGKLYLAYEYSKFGGQDG